MSSEPDATSQRDDQPRTNRLLQLSDGVIAIALTLLILQVRLPTSGQLAHPDSAADLASQLSKDSPQLVSYGISFYVIAQFWLVHRWVFRLVGDHEEGLDEWNFVFLFTITAMPFTSALLGSFVGNPLAVDIFAANLLIASLATQAIILIGHRKGPGLGRQGPSSADKRGDSTGRDGRFHRAFLVEHQRRDVLLDPACGGTGGPQPVDIPQ